MIWLLRILMIVAGVLLMHWEGQHQPAPGVWFAIALSLFMLAPLIGRHAR